MMERYENLGIVGEGSYGMVMKCRHKESNQIVAIKKFIESEDDKMVRKIAMREIKMLKVRFNPFIQYVQEWSRILKQSCSICCRIVKQLRHENLVNLLEVFRRKKRLYLVFEFVDHTVLDELEKRPEGLHDTLVKKITFQVLRGLEFCHTHNVIHRDVKPENILISKSGIVKLCDFGFARTLAVGPGEVFTDYVATRWYRAPELLVGDLNYGKAVDIWAVGCLLFEMVTGDPLFPGDSDIDQLFYITKYLGNLTQRHLEIFNRNPLFNGMRLPSVRNPDLLKKHHMISKTARDLIIKALALDASDRPTCLEMMKHSYYNEGDFASKFLLELKDQIEKETILNPLLKSLASQKQERRNENLSKDSTKKEKKQTKDGTSRTHDFKKVKDTLADQDSATSIHAQQSILSEIDYKKEIKTTERRRNSNDDRRDIKSKSELIIDSSRSTHRHPLDVSINIPGKNFPDIGYSTNASRAHGHDVIKQKKNHSKKVHQKHSEAVLCPVTEKAPLHIDRKKSIEDITDKIRKKESRNDFSDVELSRKSSLHLPIVKGLDSKQLRTSPSRVGLRKPFGSTIPHIQNIDPFPSNLSTRESPTSNNRPRDGNLPAV